MSGTEIHAVFRASAGPKVGGGHILRCLALAETLATDGWRCTFASAPDTVSSAPALGDGAFAIFDVDEAMTEEAQAAAVGEHVGAADFCIVDHYGLGTRFETAARRWASYMAVIDDVPSRTHDADLLVDPSGGRTPEGYRGLLPASCKILTGPSHALLRGAFGGNAVTTTTEPRGISRIFVSMGATDPDNLTVAVLDAVVSALPDAVVDVMLASSAPHLDAVRDKVGPKGTVHTDVTDVAGLMRGADLGIGTAGINLWERSALGIPSLLVIAAENQRDNAVYATSLGAAEIVAGLGEKLNVDTVRARLGELDRNPARLSNMRGACADVCDGHGAARVRDALEKLR